MTAIDDLVGAGKQMRLLLNQSGAAVAPTIEATIKNTVGPFTLTRNIAGNYRINSNQFLLNKTSCLASLGGVAEATKQISIRCTSDGVVSITTLDSAFAQGDLGFANLQVWIEVYP